MFELAPFALPAEYGEGILPLADVKRHCSVEASETEFDELLGAFRDAAVDMVERYCGVYLAVRTGVVWRAERLPYPKPLRLGVGPVVEVTKFEYLTSAGEAGTIDVSTVRLGLGGELLLSAGNAWPGDVGGGVEVTFTAGFNDNTRPAALVQAARMFAAHLFANREAVITGTISGEIPLGFRAQCSAYRAVGI